MSNRIHPTQPPLVSGTTPSRDAVRRDPQDAPTRQKRKASPKAQFNYIPSADMLRSLVAQAVSALKDGVYWDRGSIVNLIV